MLAFGMIRAPALALALVVAAGCGSTSSDPAGPTVGAGPVAVAEIALPTPPPVAETAPLRASVAEAPPLVPRSDASARKERLLIGPQKPRGTVRLGQVTHPDVANGTQVVTGLVGAFRSCYRRGLAQHPNAKGALVLELSVDQNGDVSLVRPSKSQLPTEIVACAAARAKVATFAPPSAPPAIVTVPLVFEQKP